MDAVFTVLNNLGTGNSNHYDEEAGLGQDVRFPSHPGYLGVVLYWDFYRIMKTVQGARSEQRPRRAGLQKGDQT